MIAAILRAQLLTMRLGRGMSRGSALALVTGGIWYAFWCSVAAGVFHYVAHEETQFGIALRSGLLVMFLYWQVVPVLSASMGSGLDMRKLLIYPASHGRLFQVEILLRLANSVEMLLVMAGGIAGLLVNPHLGRWAGAPGIFTAALLFGMFNVLLSSGFRSMLERLLSRRWVQEVTVLLLLGIMMLPRILILTGMPTQSLRELAALRQDGLPWTLAAHAFLGEHIFIAFSGLCAWTALAGLFGRWQFERSLRYDAAAQKAPRPVPLRQTWAERFYRFPSLLGKDPWAAIVEKELRTLSRAPRFRTVFVMGFSFGLLVWLPLIIGRRAAPDSALARNFLLVVSVYALTLLGQVSYSNSFGFDRSAAQLYYSMPQPIIRTIMGKNLAALIFVYLEAVVLAAVTAAFGVALPWTRLVETFLVLTICAVYLLALGNISSVHYPRPLNPERVSQGGASTRFHALIFLVFPLALLPVLLAYVARYVLESNLVFWLLMAVAALIGAALYWIAMESSVSTALRRREAILQELSKGEGPVASN